jgi:hypothetical protein
MGSLREPRRGLGRSRPPQDERADDRERYRRVASAFHRFIRFLLLSAVRRNEAAR